VEAIVVKGEGLSLNAHKVLLLMIRAAGGDAWQDRWHRISKTELTGSHRGHDRLRRILRELRAVEVRVRHKSERGVASDWEAALVSETDTELDDDVHAIVKWRFSGPMRELLRTSEIYADLRLDVVVPLESVYSLRLYELGCLHLKRRHPVWRGTKEELRAMLRVPAGAYRDWTDLRRKTLETAKAELDHIAPFTLDWQIISRRGRSVDEVEVMFTAKDAQARANAEAELQRSRVGRKARRTGTVEEVKAISPAIAADLDKLRRG
jgi:plasmid replication initiation protein